MRLADFFENFEVLAAAPGGVARLREAVLGLAVRGRLVAQDPADEPAAVLLERIAMERSRLVKEKKIKASKPLPPVSLDEVPFDLPVGWEWVRLGNVLEIVRGITFPGSSKSTVAENGSIACLRTTNVQREVDWDNLIFVPKEYVKKEEKLIQKDDILISMANSYELVGKVCQVKVKPKNKFTFGGFISVIRPFQIASEFVLSCLNSVFMQDQMRSTASQTTNIANISLSGLYPLLFPLPPLAEQKRIVEAVDRLMEQLDRLEAQQTQQRDRLKILGTTATTQLTGAAETRDRVWPLVRDRFGTIYDTPENVEQLRQTILQLAVMGRLVPQDPNDEPAAVLLERIRAEKARLIQEKKIKPSRPLPPISSDEMPFDLPMGWEWVRLANIFKFIDYRGKTPKKVDSGVPLITAKNVKYGFLSEEPREFIAEEDYEAWMTRGIPNNGDILFTTEAPLGNVAILEAKEKIALAQRIITFQKFSEVNSHFFKAALTSSNIQQLIYEASTGTTARGIKSAKLKLIPVPFPPLAEQKRIVATVDRLMTHCDQLQTQLQTRSDRAHTLLHSAIHQLSQTP